ncbi:MAG: tyrosine-type recombinase/integrase [Acetobacteraceae bacterium]
MVADVKQVGTEAPLTGVSGPLTDRIVADLVPPPRGNRVRWDGGTGFGVRTTSAGAKAFVLRYRNADGNDRTLTIGSPPAWNVARARTHADALRQQIDTGVDPLADRQATRDAPTVAKLADRFEAEHLIRLRPTTRRDYAAIIQRYIRPYLGAKKVASEQLSQDLETLHRRIAETAPYMANRVLAVASKMFAQAIRWNMRSDNPARGVPKSPEHRREKFLTPAEIARLSEALAAHPERVSANVVRLLLLTGARKGETLSATWPEFDLAAGVWTKPSAATKTGKLHRIPLSAPARQLLSEMKAEADIENERRVRAGYEPIPFVFPGQDGKALTDVKHFWASASRKAGLEGVRLHDLRHTHASILASLGLSLPIIGALLGHTQASTTQRYARLMDDSLREATERAGSVIQGAGKAGGEVVPLTAGRRR